ncbi:toxin-antitoxin system HicB family antitoxin [Undibacterium sp.]|uniref:toxin-antitoxin system HicB family antitoxin n=1 Tax=Undibacterium sp. TaxID=1914977 RepID=UPI0027319B13|nr:toxin-antitoxin system HicB family antitoxin [Undibacterium sp.]MDP1978299.1 toxin-antitoxin system HicB family antitoxin [Undibacterium sp.]
MRRSAVAEKTGRPAQKPYSGNLRLRISPETHARAAIYAEASGKSLNTSVADLLETYTLALHTSEAL